MSNRILFVDDEPMVLKGLERSLRGMRNEWEMRFVAGGLQALEAMAEAPFDVVISDMRMPGMDGAQLLDQVRARFSQTVRMVLSGQSDRAAVFRAVRPTHQYLSKPCEIEELKQKLKCALALRDVLPSAELKQRVSQMESVPSLPGLFQEVRSQLESNQPDLQRVAHAVSRDPGMTAKLLQLVNSAFLGTATRLSCPRQALSTIGLDNLRSLVLLGGLFSELDKTLVATLAPVWRHSYASARFAEAIARCEQASEAMVQDCFAAGLLHEIGWIVLGSSYGDDFGRLCSKLNHHMSRARPEEEAFGSTHGPVGAYLLGLWGLSDPIVQAVATHHAPRSVNPTIFSPVTAVHVADHWDRQWNGPLGFTDEEKDLDQDLLAQLGLRERLPIWEKKCRELDAQ